jgi:hypothetical protein
VPGETTRPARAYARLLVSDKFYNEAAVRVGRQKSDLLGCAPSSPARSRSTTSASRPE